MLLSCSVPPKVISVKYEVNQFFKLNPNGSTLDLRDSLSDAEYIGFFDSEYQDTAYVGTIKNNKLNGAVTRYDQTYKYVNDVVRYKNGKMTGIRKRYLKMNGEIYENIYLYKNGIRVKEVKIEW